MHGGVIAEAPIRVAEVYFFGDAATAHGVAGELKPSGALDSVRALGRAVVVHYSFGIGDRPGRVPLSPAELKPIQDCLKAGGFL